MANQVVQILRLGFGWGRGIVLNDVLSGKCY